MTKKVESKAPEANSPSLIAYHVPEREKAPWVEIGAAWEHKDERGFTLALDLIPATGGRIVLREFDPKMIEENESAA